MCYVVCNSHPLRYSSVLAHEHTRPHSRVVQTIVMQLGEGDMDSIIMAIGQKKTLTKMQQEYEDLVNTNNSLFFVEECDSGKFTE